MMKNIIIGPIDTNRTASPQVLKNVRTQMQKPSNDRNQVCDILRLAKGGYSHKRARIGSRDS